MSFDSACFRKSQQRCLARCRAGPAAVQQRQRIVRIAEPTTSLADFEQVANLRARAYYSGDVGKFVASFIKQFETAELRSLVERTAGIGPHAGCCCFVVRAPSSTTIIGTADLVPPCSCSGQHPRGVPSDDQAGAYVLNVVVEERHRRMGVGHALMSAAIARARELKAERLYTEVDVDNLGAFFLYTKLGFVEYARIQRSTTPTSPQGERFALVKEL